MGYSPGESGGWGIQGAFFGVFGFLGLRGWVVLVQGFPLHGCVGVWCLESGGCWEGGWRSLGGVFLRYFCFGELEWAVYLS